MLCRKCGSEIPELLLEYKIADHIIKATRYNKAIEIYQEKYPWDYLLYKTLKNLYFANYKCARKKYPKLQDFLKWKLQ